MWLSLYLVDLLWDFVWIIHVPCFIFQIEGPFWCPTKIKTPTGVYDFPLKSGDYYHTNSAGLQYEAAAVRKYIQEGISLQQIIH